MFRPVPCSGNTLYPKRSLDNRRLLAVLRSPRRPAGKSRDIRCGEASFVERCVAARITRTHSAVEHKLELSQLRCTNPPYAQRGGLGQLLHGYFTVTSQLLHENH